MGDPFLWWIGKDVQSLWDAWKHEVDKAKKWSSENSYFRFGTWNFGVLRASDPRGEHSCLGWPFWLSSVSDLCTLCR